MKKINPADFKRILVRSTNWIGDAVMTTPAVRAIRRNFPNAKISLLAKPWVAPVFKNSRHVDEIIIYDTEKRHKGIIGKFRLARDLKKYCFDCTILLQNAIEAAIITFLAGIPVRIGFNTDARGVLLTHSIKLEPEIKKIHQTGYYLEILKGMGLRAEDSRLYLEPALDDINYADNILAEYFDTDKSSLVGISPGAMYGTAKQWFPERFARLGDCIAKEYNACILIFGSNKDRDAAKKITDIMGCKPVNLCGTTTLGQAIALIKKCSCFITNDSGLMHIAAALDIPVIAIFGSTNPETTSPWSDKSRVIQADIDCSPCLKTECPGGDLKCMAQIETNTVFKAVKEVLEC